MAGPAKKLELRLRKMELDKIKPGCLIVNVGKRGSGKSFMTQNILYNLRHKIKMIVVFSSTEGVNAFYKNFIPPTFIHTELDVSKLKDIYTEQQSRIAANRERAQRHNKPYKPNTYDDNLFIIIDDFMHKRQLFNTETMKNIAFNGRHCNITFLFNIQYAMCLPPDYRSQIDICFMYKEVIHANVKRLFDYYCGMFKTYAEFIDVFQKLTNDYECMVIKMTNTDAECAQGGVENMVFWYKAAETPKFKIGHKALWQFDKASCEKRSIALEDRAKNKSTHTVRLV